MVHNKGPRSKGSRRVGNILRRKEKIIARHSKYIEVSFDDRRLKPQWKGEDGKELNISNKSNRLTKSLR